MTRQTPQPYLALGQRLRELRLNAKLTQKEVGFAAGVSESYVSGLEKGRYQVSTEVLAAMVRAFVRHDPRLKRATLYNELSRLAKYREEESTEGWQPPADKVDILRDFSSLPRQELTRLWRMYRASKDPIMDDLLGDADDQPE